MFSDNLKRLRKRKKLSQEDMARYLGITRQGYSKYENDNSEPSYDMLIKIADKFDTTTDELLGREVKKSIQEQEFLENDFPFDRVGISQGNFENLSSYQQEVLQWAASENGPNFLNRADNIEDMMEQLEIGYEVYQALKKRKKRS